MSRYKTWPFDAERNATAPDDQPAAASLDCVASNATKAFFDLTRHRRSLFL